jgi:hypothetical protein
MPPTESHDLVRDGTSWRNASFARTTVQTSPATIDASARRPEIVRLFSVKSVMITVAPSGAKSVT